jgi:hypothetical protein
MCQDDNIISHLWHDDDLLILGENSCCFDRGAMGFESTRLACCTVSTSMSCEKLRRTALLLTIG